MNDSYPLLRHLNMTLLLCFDSLMQTRSVTLTARQLHKSQPAISRELAQLRQLLRDPLFVVIRKQLVPTERAILLYHDCHRSLIALEQALGKGQPFSPASLGGVVNIGAAAHIELLLAAPLTLALQLEAPALTVRFQPVHGDFVPEELESGNLDLAIGLFQVPIARIRHQMLFDDERVCVVARTHRWAGRKQLSLQDLPKMKWLAFSHMYGKETNFTRALAKTRTAMPFSAYVSNFGLAPYFLLESDYATTMPGKIALKYQAQFDLATIRLPASLRSARMMMVWGEKSHHSHVNQWLRDTILEVIGQLRL